MERERGEREMERERETERERGYESTKEANAERLSVPRRDREGAPGHEFPSGRRALPRRHCPTAEGPLARR